MNISFSEILLILFIGLLVIKPDRLPQFAFTLGRFYKKIQRIVEKIKNMSDASPEKYSFDVQPKILAAFNQVSSEKNKATTIDDSEPK